MQKQKVSEMSKLTSLGITFLVLLLIAYGAYDFYLNYEYKDKTIHTGLKGEARKNPFYASRLFLKRMGIPTETQTSVQGLNSLPSTDTVIFITTQRTTLSPERTNKLIDWVKSGGHLITIATRNWKYNGKSEDELEEEDENNQESPDPLQSYMGIRTTSRTHRNYIAGKEPDDVDEDIDKDSDKNSDESKKAATIELGNSDKKLELDYSRYRPIVVDQDHKDITEEVKLGIHNFIIKQKIDNGMVTLVSDMDFLMNTDIEEQDHAKILWLLIHGLHKPLNQPEQVWLIHNDKMPALWDIIWRNFWTFIISLSILLFFWLFKSAQRFGPMIPKQEENRRSLNEHISSSGYFYWKTNKKQKLINSSRKAVTQRLSRVYPGWEQRTEEEKIKFLSEKLAMKPEAIQKLLFATNIENADDFTHLIKQLEKIRTTI